MIRRRASIYIDENSWEAPEQGLELFDFVANEAVLSKSGASFIPHHWHHELELFLLLEGQVRIETGGEIHCLQANEGCFINADVLHAFFAQDERCAYRSFVFDGGIVGGTPGSVFDTRYVRPLTENGPAYLAFSAEKHVFHQEFSRVFEACLREPAGYEFEVRDALSRLLLSIHKDLSVAPAKKVSTMREDRVKQMLHWLNGRIGDVVTVSDLAKAVSVGERECYRLFDQYLHCGPMEYLNRRRLLAAAERLAATDEPVTEIAMNCGFATPSYFAKQFRRLTGSAPSEYRKAVRAASGGSRE